MSTEKLCEIIPIQCYPFLYLYFYVNDNLFCHINNVYKFILKLFSLTVETHELHLETMWSESIIKRT